MAGMLPNTQQLSPRVAHITRRVEFGPSGPANPDSGSGVIRETSALHAVVIPAKAGIHSASHWKHAADGLDSRLRGNDRWFVGEVIPNDATTRIPRILRKSRLLLYNAL